jgi:hypothetical protein
VIDVRLDRAHETVSFDARDYFEWDHGYASTIARAQGASVRAIGGIVDDAATAEWTAMRSRRDVAIRKLAAAYQPRVAAAWQPRAEEVALPSMRS